MNQATRLFAAAVAAVCVCHLDAEVRTASTAWLRERSPRGHRVNLGAYGGTPYSSGIATGFMVIIR